ncbi:MAG: BolA family transcriptional regulator [Burkholderiales bacterium]|nr:BolA family transcriptional regulator [Burkholderiales bacterium]
MSQAQPVGTDEIDAVLRAEFAPTELLVRDDSAQHAGHAGAGSGGHYFVRLRSARFAGLGRVARHRLVYDALGLLIARGIHALALDLDT